MRSRKSIVLIVLAVVFLTSACAGAKKAYHRTFDDLGKAARLYNDYVRWGYTDKASEFVTPDERPAFVDWRTKLEKSVRITEVHVGAIDFPKDSKEATVLVTWTFYRDNQLTEQTKTATERWFLKDLRWFVHYDPATLPASP